MSAAPLGRRTAEVLRREQHGPYIVLHVADAAPPPSAGRFYMIAAAERWGGGEGERPFLARACSVLRVAPGELQFLLEDVGPGTRRLCELVPGEQLLLAGPFGNGFVAPAGRALLVGGGVGIAPLAMLHDELGAPALLGFRDRRHAAAAALLPGALIATDDGSAGFHGYVTELLAEQLEEDQTVFACGPPAMLEAVRGLCAGRRVAVQLALEAPMACGYGACFGCVVSTADGYRRVCLDGPVFDGDRLATAAPAGAPGCRLPTAAAPARAPESRLPTAPAPGAGAPATFLGLRHGVLNASGTFDALAALRCFGDELLERFPFAAYVTKTITLAPREGNPPPRLWETPAGMINSIGLPNPGLERWLARDLPLLAELPVPLIANVMGSTTAEFAALVKAVAAQPEVAALELNVSCPNVKTGLDIGADPGELRALLDGVRSVTSKPLIVKLTPNTADVAACAAAAQEGGADAVSLINTLRALALAPGGAEPWLGGGGGGLSGPAIRAIALAQVALVAARVSIPIIGMGGISSGAQAAEFLRAGALLVAVGTENFRDAAAGTRIAAELRNEMSQIATSAATSPGGVRRMALKTPA